MMMMMMIMVNKRWSPLAPLLLDLLLPPLTLVEVGKVVADDGDGQGDHEHPADGAHRANNLARTQITLCTHMLGQKQCLLVYIA